MDVKRKMERLVFMNYANKTVKQGGHKGKITEFFQVLIDAAREEFTEDNRPTIDGFLEDCFKDALNQESGNDS